MEVEDYERLYRKKYAGSRAEALHDEQKMRDIIRNMEEALRQLKELTK